MDEMKQIYLEFYKEQCAHGRHIETQRQAVSSMLLVLSGALVTATGALRFSVYTIPISACVVLVGITGLILTWVYGLKWNETSARRNAYREAATTGNLSGTAAKVKGGTLRASWMLIFLATMLLGVATTFMGVAATCAKTSPCPEPSAPKTLLEQLADCPSGTGDKTG